MVQIGGGSYTYENCSADPSAVASFGPLCLFGQYLVVGSFSVPSVYFFTYSFICMSSVRTASPCRLGAGLACLHHFFAAGKSTQNKVICLVSSPGMRSSRGLKILNRGRNPHNNLLSETFKEQRGDFMDQNPQICYQNSFGVSTFCKRRRTNIKRYASNTGDKSALSSPKYSEKV